MRFLVTGYAATDYIEAQGTLFFDMKAMKWSEKLAEMAGISPEVLPELKKPTDILGKVTEKAAADMGIPAGTPVICGTSDSAVEDYGAGAIEPGDCIVKLATAGNVNVMTAEAHPHPRTLTYSHVIPGMWYTVAATNAAALCQRWLRDLFFTEETPIHTSSPYSSSKAGADLLVLAYYRTYGLPVSISRCSNNYGPYHFPEKLIPLMIANALADKPLPVYGKGENIRDWLYVEDHAKAIDIIFHQGKPGETYNIGGNNEKENIYIVKLISTFLKMCV